MIAIRGMLLYRFVYLSYCCMRITFAQAHLHTYYTYIHFNARINTSININSSCRNPCLFWHQKEEKIIVVHYIHRSHPTFDILTMPLKQSKIADPLPQYNPPDPTYH